MQKETPLFQNSLLIKTKSEYDFMTKKLFDNKNIKTELLFRGSENDFRSKSFHDKCDEKGPTISIIQTASGKKFGGFASISWTNKNGNNKYLTSDNCFIFSLDNKEKFYQSKKDYSIHKSLFYSEKCLCVFGGAEIKIRDKCNVVCKSTTFLGMDYVASKEIEDDPYYLSGEYSFLVKEIEVYKIDFIK